MTTLFIIFFAMLSSPIFSMEIVYGVAQPSDTQAIHDLYTHISTSQDASNVYIPSIHSLEEAIAADRFFVAKKGNTIVGIKKAFVINDSSEQKTIIEEYMGFQQSILIEKRTITNDTYTEFTRIQYTTPHEAINATYVYIGSELTHPTHRKKGICTQLSAYATKQLWKTIHYQHPIVMMFGLTVANATNDSTKEYIDRMPSIIKLASKTIQAQYNVLTTPIFTHYRSNIEIPVGIMENRKQKMVPGFGNMLIYNKSENE